jgi:hypothetical protein
VRLLSDAAAWRAFSKQAAASALARSGIDAISRRWEAHLRSVLAKPEAGSPASLAAPPG